MSIHIDKQDLTEKERSSYELTWQISQRGNLVARALRWRRWCLLASLLAAWISTSHLGHKAASSAQHITVAGAFSHTSHCIFIFLYFQITVLGWFLVLNQEEAWIWLSCLSRKCSEGRKDLGGEVSNKRRDDVIKKWFDKLLMRNNQWWIRRR